MLLIWILELVLVCIVDVFVTAILYSFGNDNRTVVQFVNIGLNVFHINFLK